MKKNMKRLSIAALATLGLVSLSTEAARADSAIRGAYAEVRANGSSQAASFEHVLPDNFYFGGTDAANAEVLTPISTNSLGEFTGGQVIGTYLTVDVADPGTNQSNLLLLGVNAGVARSVTVDFAGTPLTATNLEDAIAEQVGTLIPTDEDVIGLIRAFVGTDGTSASAGLE